MSTQKQATFLPALLSASLVLGGCMEYTIETTLNADGSGVRIEELAVGENDDLNLSRETFQALMFAGPENGWTERDGVAGVGDTLGVLDRTTRVSDLGSWSRLSDQIRIAGGLPINTESTVGYISVGEVQFRNRVRVGTGSMSDGTTSYTFRETFSWEKAVDVVGEHLMERFSRLLAIRYPALSERQRGEIVGFGRARFWAAVDQGYIADDNAEDRLEAEAVSKTAEQAIKIVRTEYPQEDEVDLAGALQEIYDGGDDGFESFLNQTVPGMNLAFNTSIVIRLNMPGRITNSNAHERDGTTLVWDFGALDALATPIEIFAESVVER